jgi:hypothetical protein
LAINFSTMVPKPLLVNWMITQRSIQSAKIGVHLESNCKQIFNTSSKSTSIKQLLPKHSPNQFFPWSWQNFHCGQVEYIYIYWS